MAGGKSRSTTLTISPTPFRSSFLSIPPSPFSPRTPLTPLPRPVQHSPTFTPQRAHTLGVTTTAPPKPLAWLWKCHQCHRNYALGVTRRCLDDGHAFCAGTTTVKTWRGEAGIKKRVKRHRACGSEFDYAGWKAWGRWRRGGVRRRSEVKKPEKKKDCWNLCDYPSECRWGKKVGIHSPVEQEERALARAVEEEEDVIEPVDPMYGVVALERLEETGDKFSALVESAKRRKEKIERSPLAVIEEDEADEEYQEEVQKDESGDVLMTTIDPRLLDPALFEMDSKPNVSSSTAGSRTSAAMDMLKGLMDRRNSRRKKIAEEGGRRQPMFTSRSLSSRGHEQHESFNHDAMLDTLSPLERVRV